MLKPINNCVVIELAEDLEFVDVPDKPYSTRNSGIVVTADNHEELIGKRAYFKSYEDDAKVEVDGKTYAFIDYETIRGYIE